MVTLFYKTFYTFCMVLEVLVIIYMITGWFSQESYFRKRLSDLLEPALQPVRFLVKHSIFQMRNIDVVPIITIIILTFCEGFVYPFI
ncbi:MAG: YggT family protein [Lachnospiraceae bacterium]|nr:YggT family protein [Lachnospiraceae bacterium]